MLWQNYSIYFYFYPCYNTLAVENCIHKGTEAKKYVVRCACPLLGYVWLDVFL